MSCSSMDKKILKPPSDKLEQNAKDSTGLFFRDELGGGCALGNWDTGVEWGTQVLFAFHKALFSFVGVDPGIRITLWKMFLGFRGKLAVCI